MRKTTLHLNNVCSTFYDTINAKTLEKKNGLDRIFGFSDRE